MPSIQVLVTIEAERTEDAKDAAEWLFTDEAVNMLCMDADVRISKTEIMTPAEVPMHPDQATKTLFEESMPVLLHPSDKGTGLPPPDFSEMFVSSFDPNWLPTPENVNALPEPLRKYIHDIETKCDPAGDISQLAFQKDQIGGLTVRVKELEEACNIFESNSKEASDVFEVLMRYNLVPAEKPGPTMAAIVSDVLFEMDKVHTALGKFPGSKLHLAAEVRINEYKAMTEKYEAMKLQVEEAEKSVKFLLDTEEMSAPDVAALVAAAMVVKDIPEPGKKAVQAFVRNIQRLEDKLEAKTSDYNRLILAVKKHQNQKGDDRCWLDDATLYEEAGLKDTETALPGRDEFLANCARFHATRQHPGDRGKYKTVEQRIEEALVKERTDHQAVLVKKDSEMRHLNKKLDLTIRDLSAAVKVQRAFGDTKTISGRLFASSTTKYILPALKRLGWEPTKKEAQVGKHQRRAR